MPLAADAVAHIPTDTPVVLIADLVEPPAELEQAVLGPDVHILCGQAHDPSEIADAVWARADAVLAWHHLVFDADLIAKLTRTRVLSRVGVGFDNMDLQAAAARSIPVCNIPDYGTGDVADHAMALLLSLVRGIEPFAAAVKRGREHWHYLAAGPLRRLAGQTVGIIGLGRIGIAVAMRLRAFGVRIIYFDPYKPDGYDKALGLERADSLDDLLPQCDILTFHTPLTAETRGMADADFLARCRPGVTIINTARGPIIDLAALHAAMQSGHVLAAGLDVTPQEPPADDEPLIRDWRADADWLRYRLIVTPHSAFYCDGSFRELREKSAAHARRAIHREPPRNVVNAHLMS